MAGSSRTPRFTPTTGDNLGEIEAGYRKQSTAFDKNFLKDQLALYKGTGLSQNPNSFKGESDQRLYDEAAAAVIKQRGYKPVKTPKPPAPAPKPKPTPKPKPAPKPRPKPAPKPTPKKRRTIRIVDRTPQAPTRPRRRRTTTTTPKTSPYKPRTISQGGTQAGGGTRVR